ncbi:MAG: carboxymuconolactone decarboxylase, partial [Gammaproteobacteria bacterium]|nr:carboxymuconolactone decarboxylase [Gammaproteobacteria bacterium]
MPRIKPISVEELPDDVRPVLEFARQTMGFTPNDVLTMAHWPELLQAMLPVVGTIFSPGAVDMELKRLVALIT